MTQGPTRGIPLDTDGTLAANSDQLVATQKATKTYADAKVARSLYDANTVLAANTDDTPAALTMGASTILARLAAGNIVAATPAELRTLLDVPTNGEAILDAIVDAKGDLIVATAADTVARLAVGATNGHGLRVSSGAGSGVEWGALAWPRAYQTGQFYLTCPEPAGDGTFTPVLDRVVYSPFPVGQALTADQLTLGVTTAGTAGAKVRLGIYNDSDGIPGTLLIDAGTINGDSNTYQVASSLSSQALLANTLYWVAVVWQVQAVGAGVLRGSGIGAGATWVGTAAASADPRVCNYTQSGVTGALPATATPVTTSATTNNPSTKVRVA